MEAVPSTESLTSVQIVRLLASEDRRRVVAALTLADGPLSHAEITTAAGLSLRVVVDAVDRLVTAGLIHEQGDSYELAVDAFQQAARSEVLAPLPSMHADQPPDIARVLDAAIKDGRLVQWPAKRSKRVIVLDHVAQRFEIGQHYDEETVNEMLRPFSDDVAMARRYLVDEDFLDRDHGDYWRCGGTI